MDQDDLVREMIERFDEYLGNGGFFNPEAMSHEGVRDLIIDCRDLLEEILGE